MSRVLRVPPGRAGRLWLRRRLDVARRGAELLDHKLRILHAERQRLALLVERTGAAWAAASLDADKWLLRACLQGGQRGVRLAATAAPLDMDVTWTRSMGVRYPAEATFAAARPDPGEAPAGNAALVTAREAHRAAVDAAVRHAVAEGAARVVAAEEAATRRRLRAIEERWVPRLEEALAGVELALEEREHAEGVRLRWAAGLGGARPGERTERAEASP